MKYHEKIALLLFMLTIAVLAGCSGRIATAPEHTKNELVFPEDNSYKQKLSGTLTIKDKIWAVGTDRKKVNSVTVRFTGMRVKKGHIVEDTYADLEPIDGTTSFRLLAVGMRNIRVTMEDGVPLAVRVSEKDPFKLKEVLRDAYGLISAYPPRGKKIRKGLRWGYVRGSNGNQAFTGNSYFAKISREIRAVQSPEVIILSQISASRNAPISSRGFNMVGTSKGNGISIIDMQTGKWKSARAEYTFVVTASKRINGVDTTWVFKEEIMLNLNF